MTKKFLEAFEEELAALYERAGQISAKHPELGLVMSDDRLDAADVSMRLLLEGTAYLAARTAVRARLTHGLLALRLANQISPGILDALPPRCLIQMDGSRLGPSWDQRLDRVSVILDDIEKSRYEGRIFGPGLLTPLTEVDVHVEWLGHHAGASVALKLTTHGDTSCSLKSIDLFVTRGEAFEPSFRGVSLLLSASRGSFLGSKASLGNVAAFGAYDATGQTFSGRPDAIGNDFVRLSRYLNWTSLGGFLTLRFSEPLVFSPREAIAIDFRLPTANEEVARELAKLRLLTNVLAFENARDAKSERFGVDARRGNNYFSMAGPSEDVGVVRALGVSVYLPLTNHSVPAKLLNGVGADVVDNSRGDELLVVYEPEWMQPDQGSGGRVGASLDRVLISGSIPGISGVPVPAGKLDISIAAEVFDRSFAKLVRHGCTVQGNQDGVVVSGEVLGGLSPPYEHPHYRDRVGALIEFGRVSLLELASMSKQHLRAYFDGMVSLCCANSSPLLTAWKGGVSLISFKEHTEVSHDLGVACLLRGWLLQFTCRREVLASGLLVYLLSSLHRYLSDQILVNCFLRTSLLDQNGEVWCEFGGS